MHELFGDSADTILIILGVLGFVVSIYMIIAILKIPQIAKYQRAQVKLLASIAEKQGVDGQMIEEVVFESDPAFKNDPHFQKEALATENV